MEYDKILRRLANNPEYFCAGVYCHSCPNGPARVNGTHCEDRLKTLQLDEFLSALVKWDKEHPQKTYAQDFFEKHPNAIKRNSGCPVSCRGDVYGTPKDCVGVTCEPCWNKPMPEEATK